jgi:hypothetical protein
MKKKITIKKLLSLILFISIIFAGTTISSPAAGPAGTGQDSGDNSGEKEKKPEADFFVLMTALLESSSRNQTVPDLQKFMSLYTKFYHRPELITENTLTVLYNKYEGYNVLVDFIERLPIRKPETILKLFQWVENFEWFKKKNKILLTATFQSLLELFCHAAKYAPDRYDYDALLEKMTDIPFTSALLYNHIFKFLGQELGIGANKKTLVDLVMEGIDNETLTIDNTEYKFLVKDMYRENINQVLEAQEVCSLSSLLNLNQLFEELVEYRENLGAASGIARRIADICKKLPYAEISKEAPKHIRDRIMNYSREKLEKDAAKLEEIITKVESAEKLKAQIGKIKNNYLVYQLKDYLVTLAYAVNAKNAKLRIFLNPNMVRLHDFIGTKDHNAWNYCGTPPVTDYLSTHYLSGGLSRLSLAFAAKWHDHLFSRTYIHDAAHVQSVLANVLDLYPVPGVDRIVTYNALLVDFGLELLRKAREDETVRKDVIKELNTITAGYHYRKAMHYLTGKIQDHDLFFTEIKQLGERFFKQKKYLDFFTGKKELEPFNSGAPAEAVKNQAARFGGIYYRTFGNLTPQQIHIFPQDLTNFFDTGWISGEMFDEFKIKLSWHLYKRKTPPFLMGQVLYSYISKTAPRFFSQNHPNDYFSTYFLFKVFNHSHIRSIVKKLQKQGYIRLK